MIESKTHPKTNWKSMTEKSRIDFERQARNAITHILSTDRPPICDNPDTNKAANDAIAEAMITEYLKDDPNLWMKLIPNPPPGWGKSNIVQAIKDMHNMPPLGITPTIMDGWKEDASDPVPEDEKDIRWYPENVKEIRWYPDTPKEKEPTQEKEELLQENEKKEIPQEKELPPWSDGS